ncbi:Enhancer of polycomb-like protein 1 [Dispira simplex]|nr:Enhancer of polycomb-like protein 1 [Dispira simplex]
MSKFRSRKIDFKRPLPVYRASELPTLDEAAALQRTAPMVETGVEKEEEEEHHLQAAISAAQAALTGQSKKASELYIPTPDASRFVVNYEKIYRKTFARPSTYVRFSTPVEESIGCPYCMDEEDTEWLVAFNKSRKASQKIPEDVFETIMWQYETLTRDMVFTEPDSVPSFADLDQLAQSKVSPFHSQAKLLYYYWRNKRINNEYQLLMPTLRFEVPGRNNDTDPYVCFRRREVKPLRKTRRTDAHSLEKLRRLLSELETARSLLEMVGRREKMRKESLLLEQIIFKQKCTVFEQRRALGHPRDETDELFGSRRKSRKTAVTAVDGGKHTITIPLRKLKDYTESGGTSPTSSGTPLLKVPFLVPPKLVPSLTERALRDVSRRKALNEGWVDTTANPYDSLPRPYSHTFYRPIPGAKSLAVQRLHPYRRTLGAKSSSGLYTWSAQPSFRCRMGRGGRIFLDRRRLPLHPTIAAEAQNDAVAQFGYHYDPYRYDDNGPGDYDDLVLIEPLSRDLVGRQVAILSEMDQRNLLTQPAFIPFSVNPGPSASVSGGGLSHSASNPKSTPFMPTSLAENAASRPTPKASMASFAVEAKTALPAQTSLANRTTVASTAPTTKPMQLSSQITLPTAGGNPAQKAAPKGLNRHPLTPGTLRAMLGTSGSMTTPMVSFMSSPTTTILSPTGHGQLNSLSKPV